MYQMYSYNVIITSKLGTTILHQKQIKKNKTIDL